MRKCVTLYGKRIILIGMVGGLLWMLEGITPAVQPPNGYFNNLVVSGILGIGSGDDYLVLGQDRDCGTPGWTPFLGCSEYDYFIEIVGSKAGPLFVNYESRKPVRIGGNLEVQGAKSFVQAHPTDLTKEIVYISLEGPEAGTYIRGTAQLINGESVVVLPEHFAAVTNDEGLTVQLTCLDECNGLRVVSKSTKQIVIKELMGGKSHAHFDYLVQGIRKGYEDHQVIRERR